jgi:phytoene dehydrogenase-like protein
MSTASTVAADRFDAIVVGSGIGGLTAASLLARLRGIRVLVLERHYRLGGFTHAFTRPGGRRWEVGLHYVGEMAPGQQMRDLMDLVTGGSVEWQAMPSPFDCYHYPGLTVDQPVGREAYLEVLSELWPEERQGIAHYFREVDAAARWLAPFLLAAAGAGEPRSSARSLARLERGSALRTTAEVLQACVRSPELRAVLASQWGNYGLPPGRSAFVAHATTVAHYLEGGWFPRGGVGGIAEGARAVIEAAGGACLVSHAVEAVLVEGDRAIGVRARRGRARGGEAVEFRAPLVISGAGARLTYEQLLPRSSSAQIEAIRTDLRRFPDGYGVVQLFLGLRESPEALGFRGENHWFFASFDHDALYERRNELLQGYAGGGYLSFPSLKDRQAPTHSAEVITPLDYAEVARLTRGPWKRRGADYEAIKESISDKLLELIERDYAGFGALVEYRELATPLTVEHFTAHPKGVIYGIPCVPERYRAEWLGVATPVKGLLLAGSDVCIHGIAGAMMGGVATVSHLLGEGGHQHILAAARRGALTP